MHWIMNLKKLDVEAAAINYKGDEGKNIFNKILLHAAHPTCLGREFSGKDREGDGNADWSINEVSAQINPSPFDWC